MKKQNNFVIFLIIWFGDLISTIGSGLTAFSLSIYVFQLTNLATTSAMVVLCSFLPAFLLRPIGGVLADRYDRTMLIIIGNLGSALGIGFTWLMLSQYGLNLLVVYAGVIISSIFFALQNPAYKACVSDFLSPELYSKASGLLQLASAAQFLIAPLLGGILMSMMNIKVVLLIDVFSFIFSAVTVVAVRFALKNNKKVEKKEVEKKENAHFIKEMAEGLQVIIKNRGILVLVGLTSLLLFYIGLIQTLLTPMVLSFADARTLGTAQSTCAIGMLVTSIIIGTVKRKRSNISVLTTSLIFMGIFFSFIGISENIWSIIIPGLLFFTTIPYANSSIDVLIRQNIDNEKQGRVWSMISVLTYLGSVIAYAAAGFLADDIFNPLFMPNGKLAGTLGHIFGVGPGRGISFMFFISGVIVILLALCVYRSKSLKMLDKVTSLEEQEVISEFSESMG